MYHVCPTCGRRFQETEARSCPDDGAKLFKVLGGDDPLIGQTLDGRFTVLERLGKGGFGSVYRAVQHPVEREVAVKVLKNEHSDSELQVKRFFVEACSISQLRSNHTIKLFDFGQTKDGALFIAMELARGLPLSSILNLEGPLAPERAARIMAQVCDSLAEAHEEGIYHRDMKPDNIMVEQRRGKDEVKVLDFGVAKMHAGFESITLTGTIQGTPTHMSPEQARAGKVSPASDLYSVGVTLYELLSGIQPFRRETAIATVLAQIQDFAPDISQVVPKLPATYADLIRSLMVKDPAARPSDAADVRDRLIREADRCAELGVPANPRPPEAGSDHVIVLSAGDLISDPGGPTIREPTPLHTMVSRDAARPPIAESKPPAWRWTLAGISVALAGLGIAVFVLTVPRADREIPSTSGDAIVAGPFVHPVAPDLAREGAGLPAAVVANPAALAGSPPRPRGREAVAARPVRPAEQSAPSGSWTVRLTVTGPKGAAVTWKGRMLGTVPIETEVPYEKDLVECRVTLPGHKTFRKSFVPVADLDVSATLPGIQAGGSDLMPLEP